jgi:hypothetical protein
MYYTADPSPPICVNRAPVLTLWATVVAERLGYPSDTALTLGWFVVGFGARAKLGDDERNPRASRYPSGTPAGGARSGSSPASRDRCRFAASRLPSSASAAARCAVSRAMSGYKTQVTRR